MGPRLTTGKNVSAPTITITDVSSTVNRGVVTGKVPAVSGTIFLPPQIPCNRKHWDDHHEAADEHGDAN